jgi:UDP-glucose 4-epimerase
MKVLITGIEGRLGRLLVLELLAAGHSVCGLARRGDGGDIDGVRVYHGDLRGTLILDVLRVEQPSVVVHLATISPFSNTSAARQRVNLLGTQALLSAVARYGVGGLVFVSRHLYYGAAADLPTYHREEDPPHGVETYPEAADLFAADLLATTALWSIARTRSVILRFCFSLGPSARGVLGQLLLGPRIPTVLGFDPLVQFLSASDVVQAIRLAIEQGLVGVYNVGSNRPLPLSQMISQLGRHNVAIPEALFRISAGRFGFPDIPSGALSLLKYPIVVDDARFRSRTGFVPEHDEQQTLEQFKAISQAAQR